MGTTFTGLSGKTQDDFGHGEARFVTYMNVYMNTVSDPRLVDEVEIDLRQNSVRFGDVFFTTSSETPEEVGMTSVWLDNSDNIYLNSFCFGYRLTERVDSYYMAYMLRSDAVRKKITYLAQGISRYNISKRGVMRIEILLPDLTEQKLLGDYFREIDSLLSLHQRKLEKLKILKKAMLEKMFPKNGAKVPEIRFSGFTDDWEQRKLGEIGSVMMCRRIFKNQTSESGEIPFYKIGTFGGVADAFITRALFEEYRLKYPFPEKGDVLISASGSIGRTVEYTGEEAYFQDSNIVWLKHDESVINTFLRNAYEVVKWSGVEGSTIKRLYNDNILRTRIKIPTISEQEKIARFLDGFDMLLSLHQRKLEKLLQIKKSMLERMFV